MKRQIVLKHEFVTSFPDVLEEHTIYVSIPFASAIHKCCCGCGQPVVTPISPIRWQLTFDGETISLNPSIGNSNDACRSHYWIVRNRVIWAANMTNRMIALARAADAEETARYYAERDAGTAPPPTAPLPSPAQEAPRVKQPADHQARSGFWRKVKRWFFG